MDHQKKNETAVCKQIHCHRLKYNDSSNLAVWNVLRIDALVPA